MSTYSDLISNQINKKYTSIKVKSIKIGDLIERGNICKKIIEILPFSKSKTKFIFEDNEIRIWTNTEWVIKYD